MVAGAQDGWARAISRLFARLAYVQDWDVSSQGGCRGFRPQVPAPAHRARFRSEPRLSGALALGSAGYGLDPASRLHPTVTRWLRAPRTGIHGTGSETDPTRSDLERRV